MLRDLGLEIVYFQTHSKSGLDKRPGLVGADFLLNKLVPIGNNMLCLARKR
jgi:hypothetical protein